MDYKNAGVDIEAGYKSVELMKQHVKGTMRPEVLGGIGGFSGAFSAAAFKGMEHPVLLSGTDGVGTKLKLAFLMDKHDTVGIEDEKDMVDGKELKAGDVLVGMASSGVHSNGFSLVRKVFEKELTKEGLNTYYDELGKTLGETLLAPTKIYVKALKAVKEAGVRIHACSHITGGGFYENVPRMLKDGVCAEIKKDSYPVPPIFAMMQKKGEIEEKVMYNTFNMGIGMIVAVDEKDAHKAMEAMKAAGETPYVIGSVKEGEKGVTLC